MPAKTEGEHAAEGRREVDSQWRVRIENELAAIKGELSKNTSATLETGNRLSSHIDSTERFIRKMAPAGAAVDYYMQGVRVLGALGMAFQWCAKWAARFLKFVAPVAAAVAAVYATWPNEARALFDWLKFWKH